MRRKQVYIADREKLVIGGIIELIKSLPEPVSVCGQGTDAEEVLLDFAAYAPDVLFIDERLLLRNTVPLYAAISEKYQQTSTILLYSGITAPQTGTSHVIACISKATLNQTRFMELWASLCACQPVLDTSDEPPDIRQIKNYIKEHLNGDLTLETVARIFGYNHCYLSSYFSRITKKSFKRYVNELRIQQACQLLSCGQTAISEVGHLAGYPNQSYFSQVFKKYTGYTPSAYRMKHCLSASGVSYILPAAYPHICEKSG